MENIKRIATYKDFLGELTVSYKRTTNTTVQIKSAYDAESFIRPYFEECMDDHEEVKIIHLNNHNKVVNVDHHSSGGITACVSDTRLILQKALLIKTTGIIVVHNHPSGQLKASNADKAFTKKLKQACEIIEIKLLDSLILTRESYYSLAENLEMNG